MNATEITLLVVLVSTPILLALLYYWVITQDIKNLEKDLARAVTEAPLPSHEYLLDEEDDWRNFKHDDFLDKTLHPLDVAEARIPKKLLVGLSNIDKIKLVAIMGNLYLCRVGFVGGSFGIVETGDLSLNLKQTLLRMGIRYYEKERRLAPIPSKQAHFNLRLIKKE